MTETEAAAYKAMEKELRRLNARLTEIEHSSSMVFHQLVAPSGFGLLSLLSGKHHDRSYRVRPGYCLFDRRQSRLTLTRTGTVAITAGWELQTWQSLMSLQKANYAVSWR